MSSRYIKTEYEVMGSYGDTEKATLYIHKHNSCDITTVYDTNGEYLFSFDDTQENNIVHAIQRTLIAMYNDREKNPLVENMTEEDCKKCGLR